jgi:hypothetical protein
MQACSRADYAAFRAPMQELAGCPRRSGINERPGDARLSLEGVLSPASGTPNLDFAPGGRGRGAAQRALAPMDISGRLIAKSGCDTHGTPHMNLQAKQ